MKHLALAGLWEDVHQQRCAPFVGSVLRTLNPKPFRDVGPRISVLHSDNEGGEAYVCANYRKD